MKIEQSLKIAKENEQANFIFWGFHVFSDFGVFHKLGTIGS